MSSYSRYQDPLQAESTHKDLIISQLKAEIFELSHNQQNITSINLQLNSIEMKYLQLQEEQIRAERDGRQRSDQDIKTIANLRDEIDISRQEVQRRTREISEYNLDNSALQELEEFRTMELQKLRTEVHDLQEQGRKQSEQRRTLERALKRLKDDRGLLQAENEVLGDDYQMLNQRLKILDKSTKDAENDLQKMDKTFNQQMNQNDNWQYELKHKRESVVLAQNRLSQNEKMVKQLQNEIVMQERLLLKSQGECKENQNLHQEQVVHSKNLANSIYALEDQIKVTDTNHAEVQSRIEEQKAHRVNMMDDNHYLHTEIDKALSIINEMSLVRYEVVHQCINYQQLTSQINVYGNEDERAIAILSRLDRQNGIIQRSDSRVNASLQNIQHFINDKNE